MPAGAAARVEDGPLRSVGLAATGARALSVIADAGARFAALLADLGWNTPELRDRAAALMRVMAAERLSRCNAGRDPSAELAAAGDRAVVLVIDRSETDLALGAPPPRAGAWRDLLRLARTEHPDACLVLLRPLAATAPSVDDEPLADLILNGDVDAPALFDRVGAVYAVGGYLALEAVLRGLPVTCAGAPPFGGLGLTRDLDPRPGRPALDREALFAAVYLLLPTYLDPHTTETCSAEAAFGHLAAMRRHARRVAGRWTGVNVAPAKDGVFADFLAGPCSTLRVRTLARLPAGPDQRLAVWASAADARARAAQTDGPGAVTYIEDGFLRSVGLGAAFHEAGSLVLDSRGIHYDHRRPTDLDDLIAQAARDPALLARARALADRIVALGLTKYNLGGGKAVVATAAPGQRVVLVPGQVADDASVRTGGGGMDARTLLRRVRDAEPDAHIVFRPHPDVLAGLRPGEIIARRDGLADQIADDGDILDWIELADAVHVLTSLAGFEALLRGKPVTAHGWPFFAGRGLTTDLGPAPAPAREPAAFDALVAGALILYPLYVHPVSRLPCSPETFVEALAGLGGPAGPDRPGERWLRVGRQLLGRRTARAY